MENYCKYLSVGEAERSWGFHILTVGSAKVLPHTSYPTNRDHPIDHSFTWDKGRILDGYYIVFITRGEGILESAKTKARVVKAGMCFMLFPGIWHRYRPHPQYGWEEYWIGFKGTYPDHLKQNGIFTPERPFYEVGMHDGLLNLFRSIIQKVSHSEIGYQQIICGITLQILGWLNTLEKYQLDKTDHHAMLISKAKFLLQESIESPINLEEMAGQLSMSYSTFRKSFRKKTGLSPNDYLLNLRLEKAKELLAKTNLTINEIAYKTGFSSISYFSRLFKKKNQVAPKTYRKDHFH